MTTHFRSLVESQVPHQGPSDLRTSLPRSLHEQYAHPPHRGGAQGVWRARLYYLQRRPIPREPFNYQITSSTTTEINVKRMEMAILVRYTLPRAPVKFGSLSLAMSTRKGATSRSSSVSPGPERRPSWRTHDGRSWATTST